MTDENNDRLAKEREKIKYKRGKRKRPQQLCQNDWQRWIQEGEGRKGKGKEKENKKKKKFHSKLKEKRKDFQS